MAERNINSIKSFIAYYIKNKYDFKCIFGGYAATDELWNHICNTIKQECFEILDNVIIRRFSENYGKAYIVNKLVDENIQSSYFLTADSDILYDINQTDIISRLIDSFNYANSILLNPSVIALNQTQNNCHILQLCYENIFEFDGSCNKEMLCKPNGNGGIAGGCLFVSTSFWKEVGGYKVLGVYASDDANLMLDSYNRGYSYLMANTISCIHPYENNIEYINWKVGVCSQEGPLDISINNANEFWNSQGTNQSSKKQQKSFHM